MISGFLPFILQDGQGLLALSSPMIFLSGLILAEVSAMSHAALSVFHLVFNNKHLQPGAQSPTVMMLSEAESAVDSGLKSCLAWVFTNVIFRETSVSDMYVFGKFGKSCCSLSCPQRWIT